MFLTCFYVLLTRVLSHFRLAENTWTGRYLFTEASTLLAPFPAA